MIDTADAATLPADDPWAGLDFTPPKGRTFAPKPAPAPPDAAADPWAGLDFTPPVSAAEDYGKAAGSGLTMGTAGLLSAPTALPGKVAGWIDPLIKSAVGTLPFQPTEEQKAKAAASPEATYGLTDVGQLSRQAGAATGAAVAGAARAIPGGYADVGYQPQREGAEWTQTGFSVLPSFALGPGGLLAKGAGIVGATVGTEAGGKLAKRLGYDEETGRTIGGMVGGVVPGLVGAGVRTLGRAAGDVVVPPPSPELAPAANLFGPGEGVNLPRFAATDTGFAPAAAAKIQAFPFAGGPITKAAQQGLTDIQAAGTRVGEEAGATTPLSMGQQIEKRFDDWTASQKQGVSDLYDKVGTLIPPGQKGPVKNLADVAQQIQGERNNAALPDSPAVAKVMEATTRPDGLDFQGMQKLRTTLYQDGRARNLTPEEGAEYARLGDALTQDMETHANASGGPDALNAWNAAKQANASFRGREDAVNRGLGLDRNTPREQLISRIADMASTGSRADAATLDHVFGAMGPDFRDKIAASIAKNWWTDPTSGAFTPDRFLRNYNGLDPAARDALFGAAGTPGLRQSYDTLAALAKRAPTLQKLAVEPAGGAGLVGEMMNIFSHPLKTIGGVGGGAALAAILSRPTTASSFARMAQAQQQATIAGRLNRGQADAIRSLIGAASNFANTANAEAGTNLDPNAYAQAVAQPSGAAND